MRQRAASHHVLQQRHVVGLDHRAEDGEAFRRVQRHIEIVRVQPHDVHFVARPRHIDQIRGQNHLLSLAVSPNAHLASRNAAGLDGPRAFLQRDFLVVAEDGVLCAELQAAFPLAEHAHVGLHLAVGELLDALHDLIAEGAAERHVEHLRKHARAPRHDALRTDELAQRRGAKVAEAFQHGEVAKADVDVLVDLFVAGEFRENDALRALKGVSKEKKKELR